MFHKSPYKVLRNVKRMAKYLEKKHADNSPNLSILILSPINIPPSTNSLSFSQATSVSLSPSPKSLSISTPVMTDLPPSSQITLSPEDFIKTLENLQIEVTDARKCYNEMVNLKNEHIQVLQSQLENLPSIILSQLRPS